MLTIRLTRKGKKNQPFFKVVVIDKKRSAKGGRAVEVLGYVDPLTKRKSLKKERILHWIKNGAQPSATIHNLLINEKIIEGKKIHVAKAKKSKEVQPTSAASAPAAQPAEKPAEKAVEPPILP
ncbi:MAG: 30S ribosomal protein S16 [Candidatus Staskawiczbacteria bacterium RIFCSPLOWO2_01_FULL_40_39]|uniref:Small ribosomal subunit protein bS16 n=1 Tax=Candidatus Staskawiczbacteria bacterium RIFCSPHIGHO2_01_FULL_39_25 TaxID=1802202 RepID=A0A1G2HRQ5_9BACT|nr:MAG: 30S ribosomal protein S16 [Candidatus Staskawiczbacteria bacterium RIFCSPHIGHO2_01_FULL_39_25]OGZ72863.1 MAG: 30S ribosomal protein S16 [Candidatus Staskawiczbacteria bacterium RIFCSPLOWO2_01_FULL_40_39]OGZ75212.1 MAG: 30S ribosomal protein S16 [Candidatus Staskawiczbacteria bacterium RIFCSPLOWO2_02_FULL_39_8]